MNAPQAPRRGIGCGWWVAIALATACTVGACTAAPHVGWGGWGLVFFLWWLGGHLERQQRLLEEIRDQQQRRHYDRFDD